jgi:hypothetical protein
MPDRRALSILQGASWWNAGWRPEDARRLSDDRLAYAKSKGIMLDSRRFTHDEAVAELVGVIVKLGRRRVADAFLAKWSD